VPGSGETASGLAAAAPERARASSAVVGAADEPPHAPSTQAAVSAAISAEAALGAAPRTYVRCTPERPAGVVVIGPTASGFASSSVTTLIFAARAGAMSCSLLGEPPGRGLRALRARASGLAHERADLAREALWLVAHDQRVAVSDLDEPGVRQQLRKTPAVLGTLHAVLRRPHDEHGARELTQPLAHLEHVPPPRAGGILAQVPADPAVRLRRFQPA